MPPTVLEWMAYYGYHNSPINPAGHIYKVYVRTVADRWPLTVDLEL